MEIFVMSAAGIYDWPIIKQVSWLLGEVMNGIYNALSAIGIEIIGVVIIVFTIIVYTLLLPLTIKQQKFTKMSAVMQPEIQKIQKRYANKLDENHADQGEDLLNGIINQENGQIIRKILHDLQEPYKEVFMLRVMGEVSYRDIGQLFSKSESWARVTYYRAKKMIVEKMGGAGNDEM